MSPGIKRAAMLGMLISAAFAALPATIARSQSGATGTVSGVISSAANSAMPADLAAVAIRMRIVAVSPDGSLLGTLHFGAVRQSAAGVPELPYRIDDLPLGVALRISAVPSLTAPPSPAPSGFFLTFVLRKSRGDASVPYYPITFGPNHKRAGDADFNYETLEVIPALPAATPAPSATPPAAASPAPDASPAATASP